MYRKLTILLAMLFSISLASSPLVAAEVDPAEASPGAEATPEGTASGDLDPIDEMVLATDPEALIDALETAEIDPDLLPAAIVPPAEATREVEPGSEFLLSGEEIGFSGTGFEVDTDVLPGAMNEADLHFLVFDEAELDVILLDEADDEGTEIDDDGFVITTESVVIGDGYDGYLVSVTDPDETEFMQLLRIQVGNVFVIGSVYVEGTEPIDTNLVYEATEELTLAGAEHLGEVAETVGE